ncbi:hypothetical protein N7492_007225 [Penicillium capsulatum]|uniref:Uncharacterized protein n=1 Tax=Penicillium capsulatum TaxID=69766 RepID=A0A9W9I1L7_9EURO|nr:hypothetical protein N7492_007225 [Penicillium capsulatum]
MSKSDPEQSSGTDDANDATAAPATKPTFWQRFKAHMKKWCVYVGIPHFANDYINKYEYDETGLAITNPRPDAFHVKQKQKLSMGGGFSGSGYLTAFDAAIRTKGGETFAVFPVPQIEFNNGATLDIDQDLDISCVDCLSRLAIAAATDQKFSVLVTGKPDLKFGALPTAHLDIHKAMHMDEYVNTDGTFNVTSLDLLDPPVDGYNFNATIALSNPTPFTGHVTFNLTMGGSALGYVDLPNLTLHRGNGTTQVQGNVDKAMLTKEALGDGHELGVVTIGVHGHSCEYNGKDIPYYTAAIKAVNASAQIDLLQYASSLFHHGS